MDHRIKFALLLVAVQSLFSLSSAATFQCQSCQCSGSNHLNVTVLSCNTTHHIVKFPFWTPDGDEIGITAINQGAVESNNTEELYLSRINMPTLPADMLVGLPKLVLIELRYCSLDTLPVDFFSHNPDLIQILIRHSHVLDLPHDIFGKAQNLEWIKLEEVPTLKHLPLTMLYSNHQIQGIQLDVANPSMDICPTTDSGFYNRTDLIAARTLEALVCGSSEVTCLATGAFACKGCWRKGEAPNADGVCNTVVSRPSRLAPLNNTCGLFASCHKNNKSAFYEPLTQCSCPANTVLMANPCQHSAAQHSEMGDAMDACPTSNTDYICASPSVNLSQICMANTCAKPASPAYGKVLVSGSSVGSSALYSCDAGYVNVGGQLSTCTKSGTWSGKPADCQIPVCHFNPCQNNGSCVVQDNGAKYTCLCTEKWDGPDCTHPVTVSHSDKCDTADLAATHYTYDYAQYDQFMENNEERAYQCLMEGGVAYFRCQNGVLSHYAGKCFRPGSCDTSVISAQYHTFPNSVYNSYSARINNGDSRAYHCLDRKNTAAFSCNLGVISKIHGGCTTPSVGN